MTASGRPIASATSICSSSFLLKALRLGSSVSACREGQESGSVRLPARTDVTDRNGTMRLAGEVDRSEDELYWSSAAIGAQQVDLDGRVRISQQFQARGFLRKHRTSSVPIMLAAGYLVRATKLSFTVMIVLPSQIRSPSTAALARRRIRSFSSSLRR